MNTKHIIITGDSRCMDEVGDKSVHLIITSPPYWQLKDYGQSNQIGYNESYESYINNLNLVWQECHRVLQDSCRLCINIGDQFARAVYYGRYKVIPIRTEIIKFCETIGFDYMGAIIWQKVTTSNTTGGAAVMGSFPYPRNGILKIDYEFILLFKKPGKPPKVSHEIKEKSKMTKDEWNEYFSGHWNFSGVKQEDHLAMFPEELPARLIKMFSFAGDTVLDPFLGSGTTSLAAKNLDRNSIGYEINPDYLKFIKEKLDINSNSIFSAAEFEFNEQGNKRFDFNSRINSLPYKFNDPKKFNNKIDPKSLKFGSKIDDKNYQREEYYTVKDIISPDKLILNNGLPIKLIGVKTKENIREEAINFLEKKVRGEKVFLKYDNQKYDEQNNLYCYLYLKNRTLINAHLIKNDLVDVDTSQDFKYKNKFLNNSKIIPDC